MLKLLLTFFIAFSIVVYGTHEMKPIISNSEIVISVLVVRRSKRTATYKRSLRFKKPYRLSKYLRTKRLSSLEGIAFGTHGGCALRDKTISQRVSNNRRDFNFS